MSDEDGATPVEDDNQSENYEPTPIEEAGEEDASVKKVEEHVQESIAKFLNDADHAMD